MKIFLILKLKITNHKKIGNALNTVVNLNTIDIPNKKLAKEKVYVLNNSFFSEMNLNKMQNDIIKSDRLIFSEDVLLCRNG